MLYRAGKAKFWNNRFVFILRMMVHRYFGDMAGRIAAELSYYLLFSFCPLLMFLNGLLGLLGIPLGQILDPLMDFLPSDVIDTITGYFAHLSGVENTSFLLFGGFFSVFFSFRAVNCLRFTLNMVNRQPTGEQTMRGFFISILCTLALMLLLFLALVALIFSEQVLLRLNAVVPIPLNVIEIWGHLRFLLIALAGFLMLTMLYRVLPDNHPSFRETALGSLGVLAAWLIASLGFSFYVEHLSSYPLIYGSLATIVILLLWLYLCSMILVMGGELNHILSIMKKRK